MNNLLKEGHGKWWMDNTGNRLFLVGVNSRGEIIADDGVGCFHISGKAWFADGNKPMENNKERAVQ